MRPCDRNLAPSVTDGCRHPLVYGGYRFTSAMSQVVAYRVDEAELMLANELSQCNDDTIVCKHCVGPSEVGEIGGVICEPVAELAIVTFVVGFPTMFAGEDTLGGMAFSADGTRLFLAQTNPGGLLKIDTSLDEDGNARNNVIGLEETCPQPTAFQLYENDQVRYGLVTCWRTAEMFVIDLETLDLVRQIRVGTGPHEMVVDLAREWVYVANSLDATLSVVDLGQTSQTRFSEIARIGLLEPYTADDQ